MKQTVGNACGTVALTHIMGNLNAQNSDTYPVINQSFFDRFFRATHPKESTQAPNPDAHLQRGAWFAKDSEVEILHQYAARAEASDLSPKNKDDEPTEQDDTPDETNLHFIAFVRSNDGKSIIELDGTKSFPIFHAIPENYHEIHGEEAMENGSVLLDCAVQVAKQYMKLDPEEIRFSLLAISTAQ